MWVRLRSDEALADAVVAAGAAVTSPVAGLGGLAGLGTAASPYELDASPLELLLAAGRATAAVGPTPTARFNTVGWWTVFRWFWTVDVVLAGHTDLTADSDKVNNHHRWAFSEAMGLAMSLLVTEAVIGAGTVVPLGAPTPGAPVIVDVDSILPGTKRPDLWILDGPPVPGATPTSFVVEAKGRTPPGGIVQALREGTDQVLAVTGDARRIVAGVTVPRTSLTGYAIEVEPMGPPSAPQADGASTDGPTTGRDSSGPGDEGDGGAPAGPYDDIGSIPPEAIAAADAARLTAFAGLDNTVPIQRAPRTLAPGFRVDLEGVTFRVGHADRQAEVTVGLLADVAEDLRTYSPRDLVRFERSRETARSIRALTSAQDAPGEPGGLVAEDGCAISVRPL